MKQRKCLTEGCKNKAAPKKQYCHTCRNVKWRAKSPLLYLFLTRKNNAKRRGKSWSLTFDEFLVFCKETGYDEKCGRTANDLSIDRIREEEGYHKGNIRAITVSDNTKKARGTLLELEPEWQPVEFCPF